MDGSASPFIGDLFLAWQEYCFMKKKLIKSNSDFDLKLARVTT